MMVYSSKSIRTTLDPESFWASINILVNKPHVINKRLWGSKVWFKLGCKPDSIPWKLPTHCRRLQNFVTADNVAENTNNILSELKVAISDTNINHHAEDSIEFILTELLPKNYSENQAYQLVCLQKDNTSVSFMNITPESCKQNVCPSYSYTICLHKSEIVLSAETDEDTKSYLWLANTLIPQLIKWGTESVNNTNQICNESLSLVSKTKYYEKYNELKLKYGKEMVKIWPECTDPAKFVYEDVAIAAYLLLIWEMDDTKRSKTFIDLGCGNGLLVYILTEEGHDGLGLDIRKRNIWDMYPNRIKLQERTITPSDISIFPNADWIIGNHSDELTPWIPVIAAKSSYKCNFFLLPCCAYNFDGTKYQRRNSFKSQYIDYLEYITQLCDNCGFKVDTDRLKIPSTKRICLVSNGRQYPEDEHGDYCSNIDDLIRTDINQDIAEDFKPREAVEKVRNCTQIDKKVIDAIVSSISRYLLEGCLASEPEWSIGKSAEIHELIKLIPKDQLNILKSECGGIQTLLKNNHHIFLVQSGKVGLRYPKTIRDVTNNKKKNRSNQSVKIQQKPCWFYNNHPQGCPLESTDCSFKHDKIM